VNLGDVTPNSPPSTVLFCHSHHTTAANSYRADCRIDTIGVDFKETYQKTKQIRNGDNQCSRYIFFRQGKGHGLDSYE
jgi:hypothetical protein